MLIGRLSVAGGKRHCAGSCVHHIFYTSVRYSAEVRDRSLIMGKGGGALNGKGGGGACEVLLLLKEGGGGEVLAMLKWGHNKCWGSFNQGT